jgi:hypothetical protein
MALAVTAASTVQATGFVLGCLAIHRVRRHAAKITPILILVAAMLLSMVFAKLTLDVSPVGYSEFLSEGP